MRYLVTGAAGFIGAKLAERLLAEGHQVITIDNLSTGHQATLPPGIVFIQGHCYDSAIIQELFNYQFDAIFHIAGQSSGEISFDDPVYDLQTNTQSTIQLLQYALKTNCKKFIYASSMSVYGDQVQLPVDERAPTVPKSFYAVGKLASEHYMRIYASMGIGTVALRLFNVYGPGQNLENLRQGMVSIFMAQALQNQHIHVKGSRDRFRDFVFIDDVVEAFIKAEQRCMESESRIWNVCSGSKTTVGEVVDQIVNSIEEPVSTEFVGSTPGDQFGIYGSPQNAAQQLNWFPKTAFKTGITKMMEWAKQQK